MRDHIFISIVQLCYYCYFIHVCIIYQIIYSMTFLILFLLLHTQLADSLSFLTTPNDRNVSVNLPAEFNCFVSHESSIILTWLHKSQSFACTSNCPISDGYLFTIDPSSGATQSTMRINSVGLADGGTVSCEVTQLSTSGSISTSATLIVNDVLDFIRVPVGVASDIGDSAMLYCEANKEGGIFVWKRSGLTIPSNPR